jgi:flagellar hook-basal body complex protein FliE
MTIPSIGLAHDILSQATPKLKPFEPQAKQDFASILKSAVSEVSQSQDQSAKITQAFEAGDEVDVTKVMLAREKASLAFEATLQVRNKLLSAYKDIVSMPV